MYEEHYGFAQSPFSLSPDPRFLYRSASHASALQQVRQAIQRNEGFIVLTGEIGTGKTTLCRTILEQFEPATFTALIVDPFLSIEDLLRELLVSYGVVSREGWRSGRLATVTRHEMVRTLHEFLLSLVAIRGSAVLIIDEAQHLSAEILEEIRILSNLEADDRKLLLIVLVGQLNLLDVLRQAGLRQLDQRISLRCLLRPLDRDEAGAYVEHRLRIAKPARSVTFTSGAIDVVHAKSGGVPRVINLLCDRALMAGAVARVDRITEAHVGAEAPAGEETQASAPRPLRDRPVVPREELPLANEPLTPEEQGVRPPRSRMRPALLAAGAALLLIAGVNWWIAGVASSGATSLPVVGVPRPAMLTPQAPAPPSAETLAALTPPPIDAGAYSLIVGTYATPRDAERVERSLRDRRLPVYAVDLSLRDGIRRRLLVGRYPTREQAQQVHAGLVPSFPESRIVYGWFERVP